MFQQTIYDFVDLLKEGENKYADSSIKIKAVFNALGTFGC